MSDSTNGGEAGGEAARGALPEIETSLGEGEILERLGTLSRRGKLPGFEHGGHAGLFSVAAFGTYFDRVLVGEADREGEGTHLRSRTVLPLKLPVAIGLVLALTVWPGVWLTDSMLATYWGWYGAQVARMGWLTYAWYLPLMLPLPWMYKRALVRSNAASEASARELIGRVAGALDGRVVEEAS